MNGTEQIVLRRVFGRAWAYAHHKKLVNDPGSVQFHRCCDDWIAAVDDMALGFIASHEHRRGGREEDVDREKDTN